MSTTTTRNALVKPAYTDAADVGVINTNMDTIDASFSLCKWDGTTGPTIDSDTDLGYVAGSQWLDVTNHYFSVCENPADGAAVWGLMPNKGNFSASVAPDADNDIDEGYAVGSMWVDTTAGTVYICEDATDGAAVWLAVYPQGSSAHTAAADPTANDDTGDGYVIGSLWVNTTTDHVFVAADVTSKAAVWQEPILADGTVALTGDWAAGAKNITTTGAVSGSTLISTLAAGGAAPMTITSTTKVTNLNADQLDGLDDTAFVKQTLADAKGDTIVASGADTWAKLAIGSSGDVLTVSGGTAAWVAPTAGAAFWTLMPGTPTYIDSTSFKIADASNAKTYDLVFLKPTLIKWTEDATVKIAMICKSAYASDEVTFHICGDTMAKIDASSLKYCLFPPEYTEFIIPGTIPNTATSDVARTFYAPYDLYPLQIEGWHKSAGTTNSTVYDLNDDGTSIFGGASVTIATTATTNIDADNRGNPAAAPGTAVAIGSLITVDIVSASTTNPADAYQRFWYVPKYFLYRS